MIEWKANPEFLCQDSAPRIEKIGNTIRLFPTGSVLI